MSRSKQAKRLRMEALETRRVLSVAPTDVIAGISAGVRPTEIPMEALHVDAPATSNTTDVLTGASTLGIHSGSQLIGSTSTPVTDVQDVMSRTDLPFFNLISGDPVGGGQLRIDVAEQGDLGSATVDNLDLVRSLENALLNVSANVSSFDPIATVSHAGRFIDGHDATVPTIFGQRPMKIQTASLANLQPVVPVIEAGQSKGSNAWLIGSDDGGLAPGAFTEQCVGPCGQFDYLEVPGGLSPFGAAPGEQDTSGSTFDAQPSRLNHDLGDLPPAGSTSLDDTGPSPSQGNNVVDDPFGPIVTDSGGSPRAPDFVTIDIGINHTDLETTDLPGINAVDSATPDNVEADANPLVVSDIVMARDHRVQLAADARLPDPIASSVGISHRVTPTTGVHANLDATDIIFAAHRALAMGNWLDPSITEARLTSDDAAAFSSRGMEESFDAEARTTPAPTRADVLIRGQDSMKQTPPSQWQWVIDALLAGCGFGAMIFHERFGQLSDETQPAKLRRWTV